MGLESQFGREFGGELLHRMIVGLAHDLDRLDAVIARRAQDAGE